MLSIVCTNDLPSLRVHKKNGIDVNGYRQMEEVPCPEVTSRGSGHIGSIGCSECWGYQDLIMSLIRVQDPSWRCTWSRSPDVGELPNKNCAKQLKTFSRLLQEGREVKLNSTKTNWKRAFGHWGEPVENPRGHEWRWASVISPAVFAYPSLPPSSHGFSSPCVSSLDICPWV